MPTVSSFPSSYSLRRIQYIPQRRLSSSNTDKSLNRDEAAFPHPTKLRFQGTKKSLTQKIYCFISTLSPSSSLTNTEVSKALSEISRAASEPAGPEGESKKWESIAQQSEVLHKKCPQLHIGKNWTDVLERWSRLETDQVKLASIVTDQIKLYNKYGGEVYFAEKLAKSLANCYARNKNQNLSENIANKMIPLFDQHGDKSAIVRAQYARLLTYISSDLGKQGCDPQAFKEAVQELRELHNKYREPEIRKYLAKELLIQLRYDHTTDAENRAELRQLYKQYGHEASVGGYLTAAETKKVRPTTQSSSTIDAELAALSIENIL